MDSAAQTVWADSDKAMYDNGLSPALPPYNSQPEDSADIESNIKAIEQFSVISKQFIDSYHHLESKVSQLSDELATQTAAKEQQYLENERMAKRLQKILSTLPSGVVVIDGHGVVQEANPVALEMLGDDVVGSTWINVISKAFAPRSDDGHEISLADGRRVKVETKAIVSEPGQIVSLTDLTETRRLQEHQSREQRLSVIGKMMASLAHQIRTPLSSALLYSGQITSQRVSHEKQQSFQRNLQQSLKQLERHVSDMLLFASGGVATSQRFPVTELISGIQTEVARNLFVDFDIEVNCNIAADQSKYLYGNKQALQGAIANLVENSLHACRENQARGKLVSVSIDFESTDERDLSVIVTDNGCGIEKQQQENIFEPFYTGKAKGTGLGLAVVKTVVTNFKGRIEVASEFQKGCSICIKLPYIEQRNGAVNTSNEEQNLTANFGGE